MICKYTDGEISPCDTISEENNIWTTVEEGTYFVVDAEALLSTLNIPIKNTKMLLIISEKKMMKLY